MTTKEIRTQLRALSAIHEDLGDTYLALCEASGVDPLPVVWQTFPPTIEGETKAYVMYEYVASSGEEGIDIHAPTRAELVHEVFLRVMLLRSVN